MEKENKKWYKKYWWAIGIVLFIFWAIGKNTPETSTRDYVAESNLLYEKILNPKNMDDLTSDYQKAEQLFSEMQQLKDTSGQFLMAKDQMEAMVKFKEQNLKSAEKNIQIKKQFSEWDGSNRTVEKAVKQSMNNPKSYEHVATKYEVHGNKIKVYTQFRGTNAFGAVILSDAYAVTDINGDLLEFKMDASN